MEEFAQWFQATTERELGAVDVANINEFIKWLLVTLAGSQSLKLINDCPRQLCLPFDLENPPWRWVDDSRENKGGSGD